MYALLYGRDYEGYQLVGLYSSLERAQAAGVAYAEVEDISYAWLEVQHAELDAPAADLYDRRALWTYTVDEDEDAEAA